MEHQALLVLISCFEKLEEPKRINACWLQGVFFKKKFNFLII
jgi:hypothetical protein